MFKIGQKIKVQADAIIVGIGKDPKTEKVIELHVHVPATDTYITPPTPVEPEKAAE